MDKLVHYANQDGRLNVFYSTPARYVAAKHSYGAAWPLKTDDFFPYADTPVSFWTSCALGLGYPIPRHAAHTTEHTAGRGMGPDTGLVDQLPVIQAWPNCRRSPACADSPAQLMDRLSPQL